MHHDRSGEGAAGQIVEAVPGSGLRPTEGYRCGLVLQSIHEDGYTDETIAELVDAGLIERYGKILTAYALTDKAVELLRKG